MPLKVGVQLPEVERPVSWTEIAEMVVLAEDLGFDSVWTGEHLLYEEEGERRGPWEAWSALAGTAAITSRVELGPLVSALAFHNPAVLAKQAATVDEISGGRLIMGVGAGWNRAEFDAFGIAYDRRVDRFVEGFEILRRLLAGERVDFEGEFHRVSGAELLPPPRPGGPPLMIGSNGKRMLSATLPYVDMWNSWFADFDNRPESLAALIDRIDRACREVGRDPESLDKSVALLVKFDSEPSRRSEQAPPITGSPREMAEIIRQVADLGVAHVQLVLDPITPDSIRRAAEVKDLLDGKAV